MELIINFYSIESILSLHTLFIILDMQLLWYWLEVMCRNTENLFGKRLKMKNTYDSYKNVLSIVFLQKITVCKPEKHRLLWSHVLFHRAPMMALHLGGVEERKGHPGLQKGQEGGSRELLASQPHLSPWQGYGVPQSGGHVYPQEWQENDQGQSAQIDSR